MSFDPSLCRNESEVESKLIVQYLLPTLGYSPDTWHQEVALGSIRLDFLVFASQVISFTPNNNYPLALVIEAKSPKENLNKHERKLKKYLEALKISHGLLTNGKELKIYRIKSDEFRTVFQCQCRDIETQILEVKKIIGREEIKIQQQSLYVNNVTSLNNIQINREKRNMKTIAVYHNKGGVGKTTTVVNLAAALSKKGKKVLVIDLDSQANTTFAAGLMKFRDEQADDLKSSYIYHVLREKNKYSIPEVVRQSSFTNPEFDVIPSHINLMSKEYELREIASAKFRLVNKLQQVNNDYDIVLIDTPPSLNLYAQIALISAQYLIIPSDLKPFANEGLLNVRDFIDDINEFKEGLGQNPIKVLGVLASKVSTSAKFVKHTLPRMIDKVENKYGYNLLESKIFERRDISAAIEKTIEVGDLDIPSPQSILDFKPDSQAAGEFEALAQEVIELVYP